MRVKTFAVLAAAALGLSACSPAAEPAEQEPDEPMVVEQAPVEPVEPERIAPAWSQSDSPAPVELCKVEDGQPENTRGVQEGYQVDGVRVRSNVGFPLSVEPLPHMGEANLIVAMVGFDDAPPNDLDPEQFLRPQLEKMTKWSEYWSQGQFRYTFQLVDEWMTLPISHADYPVNPEDGFRIAQGNATEVASMITASLPEDLDFESADGMLVYWSPGVDEFEGDLGIRGNEGTPLPTPAGDKEWFFWSGNKWHYEDTGQMLQETKAEHTWSFWIYLMLDSQGLHNHGPGNGWPTGLQQLQVPIPEFSGAIIAWDAFKLGWIYDDQIHCINPAEQVDEQIILTPLEVAGGERKAIVIPIADNDVLVIESRRPIGYSDLWRPEYTGLLAYTVDPSIGQLNVGVPPGCGNDPNFAKWAYLRYPDSFDSGLDNCNSFQETFIQEGDSLTHGGVTVSLEFSAGELDYVSVQSAERE